MHAMPTLLPFFEETARRLFDTISRIYAPEEAALISAIRSASLTYLSANRLRALGHYMGKVQQASVDGAFVEAGVALGGSAIFIAKKKPPATALYLFDVFGQIPPPSINDGEEARRRYAEIAKGTSMGIGGQTYYGYQENLKEVVENNIRAFNLDLSENRIKLVQGLYHDTLKEFKEPVAFAHIDCDWYHSVKTCLDYLAPLLSVNGILVFDDYHTFTGCRKAVDEFLADNSEFSIDHGKFRTAAITRVPRHR